MTFKITSQVFYQLIFIILFKCVYSRQYLGDSCIVHTTNAEGYCKYLSDCPKAIASLHSQGIHPQTCGFDRTRPIVCCVEDNDEKPFLTIFSESKSKQKCKEHREYYKKNIAPFPLPPNLSVEEEECNFLDLNFLQGNKATLNEFPHMAAIGYEGYRNEKKIWLCSGALISDQFILTAAHCLTDRPHGIPKYIRIGDLDLNNNHETITPTQEFKVAQMYIHPEFNPPSFYNDIGLLKMNRPARFHLNARPACLNTNPHLPDKKFVIAGWGEESHTSDNSSPLLKETLEYFSHTDCENSYKNASSGKRLKYGIVDETQLCAIPYKNNKKCNIGTAVLQIYNQEEFCMFTIIGITSFGRTSIDINVPEVFTRVSPYTQWIEGIIWP